MAVPITGIVGDLANLVPSGSDLMQQLILGAGASVVLSGLKTNAGMDAVDPLHIWHHPATATAPAATSVVVGKTVMGSVFATLTPAIQDRMMSQGYTVVAG